MLTAGTIVHYDDQLWRIEYVNPSRAHLVPLRKREVILYDDEGGVRRRFESEQRGVNISANSIIDVVEDPQRALDEIELVRAEAELAELRAAMVAPVAPLPVPSTSGWRLVGAAPFAAQGTLKRAVLDCLEATPGAAHIKVGSASAGAVAACLDRLRKAGAVSRS